MVNPLKITLRSQIIDSYNNGSNITDTNELITIGKIVCLTH